MAVTLGFALVALAAWAYARWRQGGIQPGEMVAVLASLQWRWLAASGAVALATYVVRALRWRVIMESVKQGARLGNLVTATAIGFTAVLLFGRAGEVVRPYMIARKEAVTVSSQLGAWTVERIYDLLAALALLGYALTQLPGGSQLSVRGAGYAAVAVACVCVALLVVFSVYGDWAERRLLSVLRAMPEGLRGIGERSVRGFLSGLAAVRSGRVHAWLLAYTVAEWSLVAAACWCLFRSSPSTAGLGWSESLAFVAWVSVGGIVQIPGVGGGVQIAATVVLSEIYRLPVEVSLSMAVALWVVGFVIIVPFGVAFGLREGVNWLTMRKAPCQVAT